jgi:hypothetical protein
MTNELHCVGQYSFRDEASWLKVDILGQLEPVQALFTTNLVNLLQQDFFCLHTLNELSVILVEAMFSAERNKCLWVGSGNRNCKVLMGVSMQEYLREKPTDEVFVFNPIRSQVLSLLQFEDIFASVDDAESVAVELHLGNISRSKPAISS